MLNALTLLVICQFIGEITARFLNIPLPGPVLGLVLLLGLLIWRGGPNAEMEATGGWLLRHFGLLFVPAGVGVITQLDVIGDNWLPLLVAIPVSTFLGLAVTGWLMQRLDRADEGQGEG